MRAAAIRDLLRTVSRWLVRRPPPPAPAGAPTDDTRGETFRALLEINKKIGALVAPESLLTSIAEEAARLLGVDNAGFRLLDGDDLVVAGLAGSAGQTMLRPRIKVGESLTGKVLASGQALMCELATSDMLPDFSILGIGERNGTIGLSSLLESPGTPAPSDASGRTAAATAAPASMMPAPHANVPVVEQSRTVPTGNARAVV